MSARLDTERVTRAMLSAEAPNKGKPWSTKDVAFLRKHRRAKGLRWCAAELGRTRHGVEEATARYGITFRWTRRELKILEAEWGAVGERSLKSKLRGRSWEAIVRKARTIGRKKPNQGAISINKAAALAGYTREQLRPILREMGVAIRLRVRSHAKPDGQCLYRQCVVDPDEAREAVAAWLDKRRSLLNRAEVAARTGLNVWRAQKAMALLAATRPVAGYCGRKSQPWRVSAEDADAAAAMYRAARGES